VSDAVLGRSLPAFENGYANVNETRSHYVAGRVIEAMTIRFGRCNPPNVSPETEVHSGVALGFIFGSSICRLLKTRERTYFCEGGSMKT
jgi:hypothetical protein